MKSSRSGHFDGGSGRAFLAGSATLNDQELRKRFSIMTRLTSPKRTGNYKPGPGRPPGRKNNRTLQLEEAARQAVASLSDAFAGDAHAFLSAVYRNPDIPLDIR